MTGAGKKNGIDRQDEPDAGSGGSCGMVLFDGTGSVFGWDTGMEEITGAERTAALGKMVWDLPFLQCGVTPNPETMKERVLAGNGGAEIFTCSEMVIRHPSAGTRIIESFLFTVPVTGRTRGGIVVRDITRKKRAETSLKELNRKLLSISSTIRHDINNQLTILNGYLSLMESGTQGIGNGEIFRILEGASEKIERILKFTREYQDIGTKPPEWQVIGECVRMARTLVEAGSVRFTLDHSCDSQEILADLLLVRVFYHLIDNSLRHGQKVSEIRIRCSVTGGILRISYEDDGTGIPDKIRPALFLQGRGKNAYGLFLAREILAATGITITETGTAGSGARFAITVPPGSFRATGNAV